MELLETLVQVVHVITSILLILFILLQSGKGADLGAMLGGGGANTVFGATGVTTFLAKLTTYAAVLFVVTCLGLAYISAHTGTKTIMDGNAALPGQENPNDQAMPPEPPKDAVPPDSDDLADEDSAKVEKADTEKTGDEKPDTAQPDENKAETKPVADAEKPAADKTE